MLGSTRRRGSGCRRRFSRRLEVVVATIAFGMGSTRRIFDRDHAGLPRRWRATTRRLGARAAMEPERTYLMHSYADQDA